MSSSDLTIADLRVSTLLLRANWPLRVYLIGHLAPECFRMLVYTLIGGVVAGEQGQVYALVGCTALAVLRLTVSEVTDVPITDAWSGTFPSLIAGPRSLSGHYVVRALPFVPLALLDAVVVTCFLGLATGNLSLVPDLLSSVLLLVPGTLAALFFGLVCVAPALTNDYQNLVHNTANALVTVASGAVFALSSLPAPVAWLGSVLPLQHTVTALRLRLDGMQWWDQIAAEVLVACGWALVALFVYRLVERHARSSGGGVARG